MNLTKKLLATVFALVAFVTVSNAQAVGVSTTATATATIVKPISFGTVTNMMFGNVAVTSVGGTVVLPSDGGTRTTTGGVTLPATTGTVAAATFVVNGQADYTYNIVLPTTPVEIAIGSTTNKMTVNTFTTDITTPKLNASGTQTFKVGATLHVAAAQAEGDYTGTYTVSVNYN